LEAGRVENVDHTADWRLEMATCKECGVVDAGFLSDVCGSCIHKRHRAPDYIETPVVQASANDARQQVATERGSQKLCVYVGLFFMVLGLYFLLNPEVPVADGLGIAVSYVANIHRLTLGQTFSIVGAIFLASGIRPRLS
jgi:hypothetical protein